MLNEDYKEILQLLLSNKVRFLIVGAYALAAHGYPRAIDIITHIDGVIFKNACKTKKFIKIEQLKIPFISKENLIRNKQSTGREKDKIDVKYLKNNKNV